MSTSILSQLYPHSGYRPSTSRIFISIDTLREWPRRHYGFVIKSRRENRSVEPGVIERNSPCHLEAICCAILDALSRVEKKALARITLFSQIKHLAARIRRGCFAPSHFYDGQTQHTENQEVQQTKGIKRNETKKQTIEREQQHKEEEKKRRNREREQKEEEEEETRKEGRRTTKREA